MTVASLTAGRPELLWGLLVIGIALAIASRRWLTVRSAFGTDTGLVWRTVTGRVLASVCLVLAAVDLRLPSGDAENSRPEEVMLVVDLSRSMSAAVAPGETVTRGQLAAEFIARLVDQTSGQRTAVGLTAFGTRAFRLVPPTEDRDLLRRRVDRLDEVAEVVGPGSHLIEGLLDAETAFSTAEGVVVVLTDGEDHSQTRDAANRSRRSLAIVCGDPATAVPVPGPQGASLTYKGDVVRSQPATEFASPVEIVAVVHRSGDIAPAVRAIRNAVSSDIAGRRHRRGRPLFPYLLLIAILAIVGATIPAVVWRRGIGPLMVLIVGSAMSAGDFAAAVRLADARNWNAAADAFAAIAERDDDAVAWFNAGACRVRAATQGQSDNPVVSLERAVEAFRSAVAADPGWDEARANLQAAYRLLKQAKKQAKQKPPPSQDNRSGDDSSGEGDGSGSKTRSGEAPSGRGQSGSSGETGSDSEGPPDRPDDFESRLREAALSDGGGNRELSGREAIRPW